MFLIHEMSTNFVGSVLPNLRPEPGAPKPSPGIARDPHVGVVSLAIPSLAGVTQGLEEDIPGL